MHLLLAAALAATPTLRWPLDHDDGLAASFGELRGDRVHMGIDLRTREIGMPVHAIDAGKVVRMKEQWRGYGLAVYIEHLSGLVSVYGHLDRVAPDLEARLEASRRARKSRWAGDVDVSGRTVGRGEVFAWSGETGAGLPHLHLEVRRGMGVALDPFTAGLEPPKDPDAPVAETIVVVPMAAGATIDGDVVPVVLALHGSDGIYRAERKLRVAGDVELLLRAHDTAGAANRAGLGGLMTSIDDREVYRVDFAAIAYGDSRTSGAVLDLGRSHLSPTWYSYRATGLGGASVPYARGTPGPLRLAPGEHALELELRDAVTTVATRARVQLQVEVSAIEPGTAVSRGEEGAVATSLEAVPLGSALRIMAVAAPGAARVLARLGERELELRPTPTRYATDIEFPESGVFALASGELSARVGVATLTPERALAFAFEGMTLSVARGVAWAPATIVFRTVTRALPEGLTALAPIIAITPAGHPLRGDGVIAFDRVVGAKAAVYEYDAATGDFDLIDLGARAEVSHVGTFALLDDFAPPTIGTITPAADVSLEPGAITVTAVVTDIGTGIPERGVTMSVDGNELEVLYDPDRHLARATARATAGQRELVVSVRDRAGNASRATHTLRVAKDVP